MCPHSCNNTIGLVERGLPVDLVFQSIAGTAAANRSFGVDLSILKEGREAALSLQRGALGDNVMYFETGQGSALSANAHHGVDQQTLEARAYGLAREFSPLLVNTVVGFIGPEYLYDGKQIIRAGLEDHFCGKLLGLPIGCDVCYTNHAEADQDDMDTLLTLLAVAGVTFIIGVPGADDVMLNYQSTSFHDQLYVRELLGLKRAPEFEAWLERQGLMDESGACAPKAQRRRCFRLRWTSLDDRSPFSATGVVFSSYSPPQQLNARPRCTGAHRREPDHGRSAPLSARPCQGARCGSSPTGRRSLGRRNHGLRLNVVRVTTLATRRDVYLRRPDLGRRLQAESAERLDKLRCDGFDIAVVVADGLSSRAVTNTVPLLSRLIAKFADVGLTRAPVVLAEGARVALGDEIAGRLGARLVLVLIGERPGLSSPDSLGAYLTYGPRRGLTDAERNCVSNIRAGGLDVEAASSKLVWLVTKALAAGMSGVQLKDESGTCGLSLPEVRRVRR